MLELATDQIFYIILAAFLVGFTKTSVGGLGILAVLLMALAFEGKASPGILLPMLLFADIIAVIYYRRDCRWDIIIKLAPVTVAGIVIGYFVVDIVPAYIFTKIIGAIILIMLLVSLLLEYSKIKPRGGKFATPLVGIIAGIASMVANAAGPVFGIFLLQMGLSKGSFVGTRAWFFLLLNIVKLPFSISLGLITKDSLTLNLYSVPIILIGAVLGAMVLKMINLKLFKLLIRIAISIAAIRLLLF